MYGQTSFDSSNLHGKKTSAAPKGFTALLLGLIVCYQVVNHIFLHRAISQEDGDLDDASCTAGLGPSGYSCMEAKLFQGWHELPADSSADLEQLLVVSPSGETSAMASPPAPATGDTKPLTKKAPQPAEVKPAEEIKPEALEGLLWDLAMKMGGGDKGHVAPDKKKKVTVTPRPSAFLAKKETKPKKSFAEGLVDLQAKLEGKMQAQARRHAEHRALRALSAAARGESNKTDDKMTPWAHNLDDLTHELEAQMQAWQKHRSEHAAAFADAHKKKAASYDGMTPWAHKLEDSMHEMQEHMEAHDKARAEHAAAHAAAKAARLAAIHADSGENKSSFMDEIQSLGRELCQDPERRDRPSCEQFLHLHNSTSDRKTRKDPHEHAMDHIKLLERHLHELEKDREHDNEEIQKESVDFLKELCADPARHSYPACARVLATTTPTAGRLRAPHVSSGGLLDELASASPAAAATPAAAAVDPSQPHVVNWAPQPAEVAGLSHHVDSAPVVMQRQTLRSAHWEGKIPSVACITVLPEGQVTETLMRYFMDNYKLQHYEGSRELILVYASADKEAARIAHLYADGISIKAAPAHSGDDFPSATAFRYGAWQARQEDLVVRWDFEAWHHPNRISMQVRALALSKRPASLVTRVTAFDNDGKKATVAGGAGPHGSMMGEASWMRRHWMPLLEEETTVLHGLHSSDVVQVAMPELLAYHDISMLGSVQPIPAGVQA